jgi:membrane protein implicated in regulation of membrane protease activity
MLAAACGFIALLMGCAWLLVLAWDTPWRAWLAGGLALLFAIAALILLRPMLRRAAGERTLFFPRIRYELERDRELIERAVNGRGKGANGGDHAPE